MKLMLDPQPHTSKPTNVAEINNRLASSPVDISIAELAAAIGRGQSFCCGYFNKPAADGKIYRRNECWTSQEVFGLDFDDGLTLDDFTETCIKYDIMPAIVYTTFSHTPNHHKFRAIWQVPTPVTDLRVRWLIMQSLAHIVGQANDPKCYDPARLFFGGKSIVYLNADSYVNPYNLVLSVVAALEDRDKHNLGQNIKQFCKVTWLEMYNGLPYVTLEEKGIAKDLDISLANLKEKCFFYKIYIDKKILEETNSLKNCIDTPTLVAIHFTVTNDQFTPVKTDRWGRESLQKGDIVDTKAEAKLIDQRPENIAKVCQLAKDFVEGKYLGHNLRWMLMTWYANVKKGARFFINTMYRHYDSSRASRFNYYTRYALAQGYLPARCSEECPYFNDCDKKHLPLPDKLGAKRGQIVMTSGFLSKPLAQAEAEYQQAFQRALAAKDNKIYIIKAPTGIGKTENYLGLKDTLIAVPTHQLREEVLQRFVDRGYKRPATVGQFPAVSSRIDKQIADYYQAGAYGEAVKLIKWLSDNGQCNPKILKYHNDYQEYTQTRDTAVVTHQRVLFQKIIRQQQIIFDEDPFTSLVEPGEVKPADIDTLNKMAGKIIIDLDKMTPYQVYMPHQVIKQTFDYLLPHLAGKVSSNLGQLLKAKAIIKLKNNTVYYVVRRNLPMDMKIIILSATINEKLYRQMFGDRVDFIDIGNVETTGKIYQDSQFSYSRQCLDEHPDLLPKIVNDFRLPFITHAKYDQLIPDFIADLHFGATQGVDYMKAMDMLVIGTPHANNMAYIMYALGVGYNVSFDETLKYQKIDRNGISFWFMTYEDPNLREVQLYLIENELYQAIGRARTLRTDATVFLFSNYPIPGAIQTKLI